MIVLNTEVLAVALASTICLTFILLILCIISLCKIRALKKRLNKFMSVSSGENIEKMLINYGNDVREVIGKHEQIISSIASINERLRYCIQKVGVVRYNPFEDVGGELCFAVAFLDNNDNGVVLNSVYSREGCYIYAKPIEKGICEKYKLSDEEIQAIKNARTL